MKQAKIVFLVVVLLFTLLMASCVPGAAQLAKGWGGTAFHEGVIYAGTADGRVVAINASTRALQWSRPIITESTGGLTCGPGAVPAAIYTTPEIVGDFVYVGTYTTHGGRMYALGITDGEIIWEYPRGGAYVGALVGSPVTDDETIYISSSDGKVYALAMSTFTRRWESESLADKLWTSPAVVGDTVYVSTFNGRIYALCSDTGDPKTESRPEGEDWLFKSEAGFASSPVIYEDTIYVGSFDNSLYAIKIGASEPAWTFSGGKWFWATPLVHEGVVYAGCLDGKLYVLDAETGGKMGEFDAGSPIVSSPVMMDGVLIVADESGTIYVFDLNARVQDKAAPLKTITIEAAVRSSFCAHEGQAYIRGENNRLYVVDIDEGWISWDIPLTVEE